MKWKSAITRFFQVCAAAATVLSLPIGAAAEEEPMAQISDAVKNEHGMLVHTVRSTYQGGPTEVRVLLPDRFDAKRKHKVLYVLPVEAGAGERWGDGLLEVKQADLHNQHDLICVQPTFSQLPWYADHPTDAAIRQESHLLKVVLPHVERTYPKKNGREGRLLVGFSKSGWGAFSLLLRHPNLFAKAAAWDAPLMMDQPGKYGSGPIFGGQKNFDGYRITTLLKRQAEELRDGPRLILTGYGNFRKHHQKLHALMDERNIAHVYRDGPQRVHHFNSGWLAEAVELLVSDGP